MIINIVQKNQGQAQVGCYVQIAQMGADSSKSLDSQNYILGMKSSICKYASKDRGKDNPCSQSITYVRYIRRGRKVMRKRGYRTSSMWPGRQGFYSTFSIVPTKDGGIRPILNLKPLNVYLKKRTFQDGNSSFHNSRFK